ncbi:type II toxin-antitoxin system YafQ family toxin [Lacticaseibacillus kribbianus]|uniref:type II toxin-antitoxin system YafQ family toxin n=1 Tax=Lacticaseibacillus kribbianus TaxID=2926292 RepID=UPI001CD4EF57|nr:type II toxin-antitoxin system YafQ family toxin [Lacticaseibacillus kribbianus]
MYKTIPLPSFRRDLKRLTRKHYQMAYLKDVVSILAEGDQQELLMQRYADHLLSSDSSWRGHRELHVARRYNDDWLLIYRLDREEGVLELVRTGSHRQLLGV